MVTREQYVADLRKRHPNIYSSTMPDEFIYHMGRQSDPYADVEDWEEMGYVGGKKTYAPQADVSPSGWNELVLKDIDDDSWEWVKHAYANSLQGTLDQWYNGKLDYNIERDYDELNIGEKILAGVGSFMMPLDLLTLRIGAPFVGSVMGAGLKAAASKAGAKEVAESAIVKGLIGKANALGKKAGLAEGSLGIGLNKAIMSGNTIGLYEAAKGGLAADIAGDDPFEGIAHGYVHGAMIGAVMGGVGGAMESNFLRYKMLKEMKIGKRPDAGGGFGKQYTVPELEKLMKYTGKHGQYAAEVASLQAFNIADTIKNGELKGDQLLEQLIVDAGFVKLMGIKNKTLSRTIPILKEYRASLDKFYDDFKRTRDMGTEAPFNPKSQVFSEKSEINNIIRETEGKSDAESLKIADTMRQAKRDLEDNLKIESSSDLLKKLVHADDLINKLNYHEMRLKDNLSIKDATEQRRKIQELTNDIFESQGVIEEGLKTANVSEAKLLEWRAKLDNAYVEGGNLEKEAIGRKVTADEQFKKDKEDARALYSMEDKSTRRSPEDFKNDILSTPELTKIYIDAQKNAKRLAGEDVADIIIRKTGGADIERQRAKVLEIKKDIESLKKPLEKDFETNELYKTSKENYNKKQTALKRLDQYKDKVSEDDLNALFQYASEGGWNTEYSKTVGDFLKWVKDNKRKEWADVTNQDVYDYNNNVILKRKGKNKLTSKDISPFSTFGAWSKGKWTNKNVVEGISFEEANKARFEKVIKREIKSSALDAITPEKIESAKKVAGKEGGVLTELAKFGLRREEVNKFRLSDIAKEEGKDGRYYIDTSKIKKKGTVTRPLLIPKALAEKLFALRDFTIDDLGKVPKNKNRVLFGGKKIEKVVDGKKIKRGILAEVGEHIWGKGANYRDARTILSQLGLKAKSFSPEEVGFTIGDVQGAIAKIYQMRDMPLREQLDIIERVFVSSGALKEGEIPTVIPKEPKAELKGDAISVIDRAARNKNKEDFLRSEHDVDIGSIVALDRKFLEGTPKSRTPDAPIIVGIRDGKVTILDGLHRYYEALDAGRKTVRIKFAKNEGIEALYDKVVGEFPDKPPAPPARDVDIAVGYIKKSKIPHEKPSLAGKLKGMIKKEQKSDLEDKNIVINALSGTPEASGYKIAARQIVNNFIERHMEWRDFVSKNPNALKKNPNIGDVAFHSEWIKNYKYVLKALEKAPSKLEYSEFAGKKERNRLVGIAKELQKNIGISEGEKQLGKKAYEKQLFEDTEGLFGKGVKSLSRDAENALSTDNLTDYINFIGSENYLKTNRRWRGRKQVVDDLATEYGVKNSEIKEKLKSIGVKDGEWENIQTKSTVDYILSWISGHEKLQPQKSHSDMMIEKMHSDTFGKFPGAVRRVFTSPMQVFFNEKLAGKGGQRIIQPFLDRLVTKRAVVAIKNKYTNLIKKEVPKIKDMDLAILIKDPEIQRFWRKNGELTSEEIRRIDNSYKEGTWEYRVKKHLEDYFDEIWGLWGKYGEEVTKNPRIREQLEDLRGKMYQEDYHVRKVNPKLLEAIESSTKFFDEAIGLEKMMAEETTKYINAQIRKNIKKPVKKDFKKDSQFKKALDKYKDDVSEERARLKNDDTTKATVADIVYNYMTMKPHKLENPAFMERGVLFPRYVTIKDAKGKTQKIKSYLENWNDSFDYYGNSQADHLSTWRHVPEFSSLGKKLKVGSWKNNLLDYLSGRAKAPDGLKVDSKWADYIGMWLESTLGMEGSYKERHNRGLYRFGGILASTGAVSGMSTPIVPGFKNVTVGFTFDMAIRPLRTTLQGWLKTFDPVHRKEQGEKGYTNFMDTVTKTQKSIFEEIGLTEKLPLGKYLTTESIFKINLVSPTEDIARIGSSTANRMYAQQLVDAIKGHKNVVHKYMGKKMLNKQFEFTAKNLFRWTPEEIQFIKKTKYEDLNSKTKTNPYTETNNSYQYAWMMKKAEFFGQGATQGLTDPITLPLWMSSGAWRPLTLFTRMATSATAGMWTNVFRPIWEVGNVMPLVRYSAGSVFTGAGLYAFYKYIMGQDQMHEMSDDKWKTVLQMAWRAEFLGMFSHILNPHSSPIYGGNNDTKFGVDPSFATDFFEPYMIRGARSLVEGVSTVMTDPTNPKGWTDAMKHVTKTSVSIVGHTSRQWDRLFYPEVKEWNKFRTAARSFKKEKGYDTPQFKLNTARQVYYRDLKNNFWRGDEKEFAKSYYAALAQIDTEMLRDGYISQGYRRKQAMRSIEQSLKSMNPVNFSAEVKGREMSKRSEFLNYLKNYDNDVYRQALNSEKTFNFKLRKLLSTVQQSKYKLNYSPYYDRY